MPTPLPIQLDRVPDQDKAFENLTYLRSLALTRLDLQFAVNFICQKMHMPSVADYTMLKRILRYVKGTLSMGITFSKDIDFTLRAYSGSDWAGCKVTRRSTRGYCTFLGNNLISWSSKEQEILRQSIGRNEMMPQK